MTVDLPIPPPQLPDALRQAVALAAQSPDDPAALAHLDTHLGPLTPADRSALQSLATRLVTAPEIAARLLERALDITDSADTDVQSVRADLLLQLAFTYFSAGDDSRAAVRLAELRALEGDTVRVLHLEATLTPDDARRKKLYTKILMMEPNNRTAWEHLLALRR